MRPHRLTRRVATPAELALLLAFGALIGLVLIALNLAFPLLAAWLSP